MGYRDAWDLQRRVHADRAAARVPDTLLLLEHPPVITMGPGHDPSNLLRSTDCYASMGIEVVETDRGGDVTFHGPGQLVGYPIFDLRARGRDIHAYLRDLESAIMLLLREFGLGGERRPPHTGVWVGDEKICAIGVKVSKWVTLHGFALNVDPDLAAFGHIVPCGIRGLGVTSLAALGATGIMMSAVEDAAVSAIGSVFGLQFEAEVPATC